MAINVSVQYDGGFLPDIILLTQCYYHRGTRLNAMKRFCIFSYYWSHLNVLTFFPLTGGCSEGLGAFRFYFKRYPVIYVVANSVRGLLDRKDQRNNYKVPTRAKKT